MTNEKRLLERAGLREIDAVLGQLAANPEALAQVITGAEALFASAFTVAGDMTLT